MLDSCKSNTRSDDITNTVFDGNPAEPRIVESKTVSISNIGTVGRYPF
jgi:hypothetical protein